MAVMTSPQIQAGGHLERCKNFTQSNSTVPAQTTKGHDTDFGAVMYIIVVLTFYSLGIVVMIVKYLKTERKEMEEEMVLDSFFKGIPDKRIEHEIESVNRVAIHAFHTLTASRAAASARRDGGSIAESSVESYYNENNTARRESDDHVLGAASHLSLHREFDDNHNQRSGQRSVGRSESDAYLSVDPSSSCFHIDRPKRKKRTSQNKRRGGETVASREPDEMAMLRSDDVDRIRDDYDAILNDTVGVANCQLNARNGGSRQSKVYDDNLQHGNSTTVDVTKVIKADAVVDEQIVPLHEQLLSKPKEGLVYGNEKPYAKQNKTVIFSDATKPSRRVSNVNRFENSEKLCPKPTRTRHFSSYEEIKKDPSLDNKLPLIGLNTCSTISPRSSQRSRLGLVSTLQRTPQIGPVGKEEIKKSGRNIDVSEDLTASQSRPLFASSSCNAIGDVQCDSTKGSLDIDEISPAGKEPGAFVNESSPLRQSNQHVQPYQSTSSGHVTTRVKLFDPNNKQGTSARVLVTDL